MNKEKTITILYDLKKVARIQKNINALFPDNHNTFTDDEILKHSFCVEDPTRCIAIEPLTDTGKLILKPFIDTEDGFKEPTAENFEPELNKEIETGVNISSEFTLQAIKILESCGDSLRIYSKKDYPLLLENYHFKIIIAPRVEYE